MVFGFLPRSAVSGSLALRCAVKARWRRPCHVAQALCGKSFGQSWCPPPLSSLFSTSHPPPTPHFSSSPFALMQLCALTPPDWHKDITFRITTKTNADRNICLCFLAAEDNKHIVYTVLCLTFPSVNESPVPSARLLRCSTFHLQLRLTVSAQSSPMGFTVLKVF